MAAALFRVAGTWAGQSNRIVSRQLDTATDRVCEGHCSAQFSMGHRELGGQVTLEFIDLAGARPPLLQH